MPQFAVSSSVYHPERLDERFFREVSENGFNAVELRILPGHPPYSHNGHLESVEHDKAHLQQYLEFCHDIFGCAFVKRLGAIAALQYEGLASLRLGDMLLEGIDFP